ncbi:MAG: response regulator [Flavobacterium sp.]|uniref:response regulator n=1 Tax=unclassified Flavobacterium TaxID=196869 RepID=UPI000C64DDBE|nr:MULTISPECIES: response regulator [unclassified Flavobacterium]MBF03963.1 response regulator [Flavobacterium sp.]MCO6163890.1 response regulator [Flavobacterium sp. NRK F7]|tara:strand:- start:2734 stop:3132 length:399 start_codon:yes stop_codon:yes gene_type:complete
MKHIKNLTLVDDDDVFVFLTKKTIEQTHLVDLIRVFNNGMDALNFLKENKDNIVELPEIIFLDLSMPIMNGWQFLEEYTKLNPYIGKKISIYICSSSISQDDITRAKAINEVTDYIIKPIAKTKLIDLIKNL